MLSLEQYHGSYFSYLTLLIFIVDGFILDLKWQRCWLYIYICYNYYFLRM